MAAVVTKKKKKKFHDLIWVAAAVKVSIVFNPNLSTKRQKAAPRNSASERYFRKKAHHA